MSEPVIFKDLPATFPERDKYKKPSVIGSILFHGLLIFAVIIIPLLMPQTIPERELLVTLVSPIGPPPPPPPPKAAAPVDPVRVGGVVKEPRAIKMVPPVYPPLASRARVNGTVVLEATLTAQGTVEEIRVISGHPLLVEAAIECVKKWQYEPTYLNGDAVPVILTAKVHFLKAPIS